MNENAFMREAAAFQEFAKFMEVAQRARNLFEAAGHPLPTPLARVFDTARGNTSEKIPQVFVPPPISPNRPPDARQDWIWVKAKYLSEMTMVLGIIRLAKSPLRTQKVLEEAKNWNEEVVSGSLYNAMAQLRREEKIDRTDEGFTIRDGTVSPQLYEGNAWGPVEVFQRSEIAAYRREVILHLLRINKGGLMQSQILQMLTENGVCAIDSNKDTVKSAFLVLSEEGKVKRVGGSKKWTVNE